MSINPDSTESKYALLKENLKKAGSLAVAFSAGVDSTFLLSVAKEVLGDNVLAITAKIHSMPLREDGTAKAFCEEKGIRFLELKIDELKIPGFEDNPPNRCYICKKTLFSAMKEMAEKEGFAHLAEGSNSDDIKDYRPGMQALYELGILSPLKDAGFTKEEIRALSKDLNLPTWDKPSSACLSSRFVYGEKITEEKLRMVDAAESYLHGLGIGKVRVRMHGENLARIEVGKEDFGILTGNKDKIHEELTKLGFLYVTMDLKGYRLGSMNEGLKHV